jgi:hypothetical protein
MFNITNFRSSINDKGILRTNKYLVQFKAPNYIAGKYSSTDLMSIRCENVSIPGFDFASADGPPRMGYGAIEKHPYVPGFGGMSLTFLMDSKSEIYNFFYDWTMCIVNFNGRGGTNYRDVNNKWKPYEVGYKRDYQTQLNISVYDGAKKEGSSRVAGNEVLSLKVYSAFPLGLPSIPLAWESTELVRLTVPFSYTDFEITRKEPENQAEPEIQPKIDTGGIPITQNPPTPARVALGFGAFDG